MTQSRPFTMLAAAIFGVMAIAHAYRLATHFQLIIGSHTIANSVSWIAMVVAAVLTVMLFREARR